MRNTQDTRYKECPSTNDPCTNGLDLLSTRALAFPCILYLGYSARRSRLRSARLTALLACWLLALAVGITPAISTAQESPAQWIARIFDPASLGVTPFPGAELNRKQSVDAIVLERGGDKRIAIFIMPFDQQKAAADHFAKQFGVPPTVSGENTQYLAYTFDFTEANKAPPKLAGLRVVVSRAQFVDGKGQITMDYQPPKAK